MQRKRRPIRAWAGGAGTTTGRIRSTARITPGAPGSRICFLCVLESKRVMGLTQGRSLNWRRKESAFSAILHRLKGKLFPEHAKTNLFLRPSNFGQFLFVSLFSNHLDLHSQSAPNRVPDCHFHRMREEAHKQMRKLQDKAPQAKRDQLSEKHDRLSFSRENPKFVTMGPESTKRASDNAMSRPAKKTISLAELRRLSLDDLDQQIKRLGLSSIPAPSDGESQSPHRGRERAEWKSQETPRPGELNLNDSIEQIADVKRPKAVPKIFLSRDARVTRRAAEDSTSSGEVDVGESGIFFIHTKKSKVKLSSSSDRNRKSSRHSGSRSKQQKAKKRRTLGGSDLLIESAKGADVGTGQPNIYTQLKSQHKRSIFGGKSKPPIAMFGSEDIGRPEQSQAQLKEQIQIVLPERGSGLETETEKGVTSSANMTFGQDAGMASLLTAKKVDSVDLEKKSEKSSKFFDLREEDSMPKASKTNLLTKSNLESGSFEVLDFLTKSGQKDKQKGDVEPRESILEAKEESMDMQEGGLDLEEEEKVGTGMEAEKTQAKEEESGGDGVKEPREPKGPKEPKEPKETKEPKEPKDVKEEVVADENFFENQMTKYKTLFTEYTNKKKEVEKRLTRNQIK